MDFRWEWLYSKLIEENFVEWKSSIVYEHLKPYKMVVDLGCGDNLSFLIKKDFPLSIIGIDLFRPSLMKVKQSHKSHNVYVVQARVEYIPIKSNCVDIVISSEVIEHLCEDDVNRYLLEICRILKNDGIAIFTTPWLWEVIAEPAVPLINLFLSLASRGVIPLIKINGSNVKTIPRGLKLEAFIKKHLDNRSLGLDHQNWHSPLHWRKQLNEFFYDTTEIGQPLKPFSRYNRLKGNMNFIAQTLLYVCKNKKK
jgi:ubiquinone/menaquinone biosynthesis C-methylase UbiE